MRIFLSYGTPDFHAADALRRAWLELEPGLEVHLAPHRNDCGAYLVERVAREIARAEAFVLLLGERADPSQEIEYFEALRRQRAQRRPRIVVALRGEAAPALPGLERFAWLATAGDDPPALAARLGAALAAGNRVESFPGWRASRPYRGLQALEAQDGAFLAGREALAAQVLQRLAEQPARLPVLVGNPGVGKSSLAMAGVIGALRRAAWPLEGAGGWPSALAASPCWPVLRVCPGRQPIRSLAAAFVALWREDPAEIAEETARWTRLLRDGTELAALLRAARARIAFRMDAELPGRLVLFVDRLEELYLCADDAEAGRFSGLLAKALGEPELLALASLRADCYGRLQADGELFAVADALDVAQLDRAALERVLRAPAELHGVALEPPDMVEPLIAAAAQRPGTLPLLCELLAEAWREMAQRPGEPQLRLPGPLLELAGPLADKGERFVAEHPDALGELRRLFTLRLALLPREGEALPRRCRRDECSAREWALIEAMAAPPWRFATIRPEAGEAVAELAHQVLLRHWPRVAGWLDESREFLVWKSRFEPAYRAWEDAGEAGREQTWLSGLALDLALRWIAERAEDLAHGERLFIEESRIGAGEAAARERARAQRRERRRRALVGMALLALALLSVASLLALQERQRARQAEWQAVSARDAALAGERAARDLARHADARRLAVLAGKLLEAPGSDPETAALLAAEALARAPDADALAALRAALGLLPEPGEPLHAPWPHARVLESADGTLRVFERGPGEGARDAPSELLLRRPGQADIALANARALERLALAPDGALLAGLDADGALQVWDTAGGERLLELDAGAQELAFVGPRRLLLQGAGGHLRVIDAFRGELLDEPGIAAGVLDFAGERGGRRVVSFGLDRHFRARDVLAGRTLWTSTKPRPDERGVELSADGELFADRDEARGALAVGDTASGETRLEIALDAPGVHRVSPDGRRLAFLAEARQGAGELRVWALEDGRELLRRPLRYRSARIAFLPGSERLVLSAQTEREGMPEGFVELIELREGTVLWRAPAGQQLPEVLPLDEDLLLLPTERGGRLLASVGELRLDLGESGRVVAAAAAREQDLMVLVRRPPGGATDLLETRSYYGAGLARSEDTGGQLGALALDAARGLGYLAQRAQGRDELVAWRLADASRVGRVEPAPAPWRIAALDADGALLGLDAGGRLTHWDLAAGRVAQRFAHLPVARAYAVGGDTVVSWVPGELRIGSDSSRPVLLPLREPVRELAVSGDGARVALLLGTEPVALRLWQAGGGLSAPLPLPGAAAPAFDRNGQRLLLRSGRAEALLVDPDTLRIAHRFEASPGSALTRAEFSADGARVIVEEQRERQRMLRVFAAGRGQEVLRLGLAGPWQRSPDPERLLVADAQGHWQSVSIASSRVDRALLALPADALRRLSPAAPLMARPELPLELPEELRGQLIVPPPEVAFDGLLAVDPGGTRLAVAEGADLLVRDAADGREIARWAGFARRGEVRFVAAGDGLVALEHADPAHRGDRARLWLWRWLDAAPRELGATAGLNRVAASAHGRWLASGEGELRRDPAAAPRSAPDYPQTRVWDGASGALLRTLDAPGPVEALAFSPDSTLLAARSGREILVYRSDDWSLAHRLTLEAPPDPGGELLFVDERRLAVGVADGARLWTLGEPTPVALPHAGGGPRLERAAAGGLLLTVTPERLRLWSAEGELRLDAPQPGGGLRDAFFAGGSGEVLLLDRRGLAALRWRADELLALACRRLGRSLDAGERERFALTAPPAPVCAAQPANSAARP